jgi:hypothetical protein
MTRSSSKADLHPPEPTINGIIMAPIVEAPGAEAGGVQHPVLPSSQQRTETRKVKSAPVEREKNEDAFVWMGARDTKKHTIHILFADWFKNRRCGLRSSEVQLYVIFCVSYLLIA